MTGREISDLRAARVASRVWFAAGVRRSDRRRLAATLLAEATSARENGAEHPLSPDVSTAARAWAEAEGLAGRRLRLALLLPVALLAGVVGGGGVLTLVGTAFTNGGNTVLADLSGADLLLIYVGGGLLACVFIWLASYSALRILGDPACGPTSRNLLILLPFGGILAAFLGVAVASELDYRPSGRTMSAIAVVVLTCVALVVAAARWRGVRQASRAD